MASGGLGFLAGSRDGFLSVRGRMGCDRVTLIVGAGGLVPTHLPFRIGLSHWFLFSVGPEHSFNRMKLLPKLVFNLR